MKSCKVLYLLVTVIFLFASITLAAQTLYTPNVNSRLFLGDSAANNQPLIVGLGGSEGGNAWAGNYWKATRDAFLQKGYAFLAIGYFKAKGAPDTLDRIAIDQVHNAILQAAKNPHINRRKIAIIGGSRGGDLALLIASYYRDISCVVAIVPGHVVFPGNTSQLNTSAFSYTGKPLPYVPVSEEAVPYLIKGNLRQAFETMLYDTVAEQKASIKVERIHGPVLLLSATKDEVAPTTAMCNKIMARLKAKHFKYYFQHIAIAGGHSAPLKHFDVVFDFIGKYFAAGL